MVSGHEHEAKAARRHGALLIAVCMQGKAKASHHYFTPLRGVMWARLHSRPQSRTVFALIVSSRAWSFHTSFPSITGDVCSIEIVNKHHGEVPFEVKLLDRDRGEAVLEAKRELNCEKRRSYKFAIRAVACNGQHSEK